MSASRFKTVRAWRVHSVARTLAMLAALTLGAACGDGTRGSALRIPAVSRPKLIYTPSNEPDGLTGLTYLRDHVREIEQGPFDGLLVNVGMGHTPWGTVQYTRAEFEDEVQMLRSVPFVKLTDNFHLFNARTGGVDWFSDEAFGVVVQNARVAAEVVRDAGLKGLFFDVEEYTNPVWTFPSGTDAKSLASYQAQAHKRGVEFMKALIEVKADITILATVSYSEVFRSVCLEGVSIESERYRLLPAFFDGMSEARAAAGAPAVIVDGFLASYAAKDPRSFPLFRDLIKGQVSRATANWFGGITSYRFGRGIITWDAQPAVRCGDAMNGQLTRDMPVGFGIMLDFDSIFGRDFHFDSSAFNQNFFTPDQLSLTLSAALGSAERYVFLWSATMDWIGVSSQPRPPAAYVNAVVDARRASANGGP